MIDIEKKRKIAEAATPGPWGVFVAGPHGWGIDSSDGEVEVAETVWARHDAAHIAENDPASVLEMCGEIERLRDVIRSISEADCGYDCLQTRDFRDRCAVCVALDGVEP